jgi:hypothetical protein
MQGVYKRFNPVTKVGIWEWCNVNWEQKVNHLVHLTSSKTMRQIGGNQKKAYKYVLCGIFVNIIWGKELTYVQNDLYRKAQELLELDRRIGVNDQLLHQIRQLVQQSMKDSFFKEPIDDDTTTKVIELFRKILADLKKGKTLFQAYEFEHLIDIKKLLHHRGVKILDHHWLEFNLEHGLTHTIPVFIILGDLKIHWNHYVEKMNFLLKEQSKIISEKQRLEFEQREDIREIRHTISGLFRTMIFTAVTFVESYLHDLFFNIKHMEIPDKEKISGTLEATKITDKEIIERVIYVLFPDIKKDIDNLFRQYVKVVNERDRYVHASAFKDESNNKSKLQYLLKYDNFEVSKALAICVDFVKTLESKLPSELQFLYWWDRFEEPDFTQLKKISLINKNAAISKLVYFNA